MISAGAVAKEGIIVNRGANSVDSRNSRLAVGAIRPLLVTIPIKYRAFHVQDVQNGSDQQANQCKWFCFASA